MTIGERIKYLRTSLNMTQDELAKLTGYKSRSSIQKIEAGERDITQSSIVAFAKALKTTPGSLMGWDRELDDLDWKVLESYPGYNPKNGYLDDYKKMKGIIPIPEMRKIPLLGAVACGKPIYREEDEWISLPTDIKADFCLRCEGDSMIDARINDGDIVFIKACPEVENGQIAAVSIDNEVTLKRVFYYPEKNKLVLYPENKAYEPFVYMNEELNDIRILGRAVVFLSRAK